MKNTAPYPPDFSLYLAGGRVGILLIHGLGGTPVELKSVARGLHGAGYSVLSCQLAGHCGTEEELRNSKLEEWRASVAQACQKLHQTCDILLAGGLSMGALLALDLARQPSSKIAGLLLFAPTLKHDGWAIPWYAFLLDVLIDTPIGRRWRFFEGFPFGLKDARVRHLIVRAMQNGRSEQAGAHGTPSQSVKQFWRLIREVKHALPEIYTPALIVHARHDDVSSLKKNAFLLQERLGELVETVVLDDSYHIVTLDRQRQVLVERAIAYVAWIVTRVRAVEKRAAE